MSKNVEATIMLRFVQSLYYNIVHYTLFVFMGCVADTFSYIVRYISVKAQCDELQSPAVPLATALIKCF